MVSFWVELVAWLVGVVSTSRHPGVMTSLYSNFSSLIEKFTSVKIVVKNLANNKFSSKVRVVKNVADNKNFFPKRCKSCEKFSRQHKNSPKKDCRNADLVEAATEYGMTMLSMS